MILKGFHNKDSKVMLLPHSDHIPEEIDQNKQNENFRAYMKYILPFDVVRLLLSIILFCVIIILIRQSNYLNVNFYEESKNLNESIFILDNDWILEDAPFEGSEENIPENTKICSKKCSNIPRVLRFDCHPENGASQLECESRGCCWNPTNKDSATPLNVPYCYYPEDWDIYSYRNFSQDGNDFSGQLELKGSSFYKNDLKLIQMESISMDESTLRVKIFDPLNHRYEPPWPIRTDHKPFSIDADVQTQYRFSMNEHKTGFKVQRSGDNTTLFNSINVGGFIFADQFLQISSILPTRNIYGLGEHRTHLRLNTFWQSLTFFNKDQPPTENANLYGSHPFYFIIEESGNCHGVLFLNSNAMDVILQPTPAITFRTIGGIFDIYFFMGPTPADVLRQYSNIVGKPFLPPYWSLGFHLCRFGYGTLEKTKEVWNRTRAAGIPFDTQWNDLDYMDKNNDFTYNKDKFKDLPQFVDEIHSVGMHYIPLIDAGISASEVNGTYLPFDEGLKKDIFIKSNESNVPFVGKVWNLVSTTWPDFTHPNVKDYWKNMMSNMHQSFAYDGAWIDMNEPSNFYNGYKNGCTYNKLDYPPYLPNVVGNLLASRTVCMNAKHHLGYHYDLHNTYGTSEAVATNYALTNIRQKRPFIISRSTWTGHGFYAGHWTGDIYSSWHDLRMSISEILGFSFYQIPMVGADICGFDGNTTAELCNRWMQLGAFYPFSRNHNSDDTIEQDPVAMGDLVVTSSKKALRFRYWLLPYLYTLFYRAHRFGETVARPLFFEFVEDTETYEVDSQFLWGSSLMIVPVLEQNKTEVSAYVPHGVWYNLHTKAAIFSIGSYVELPAPVDTIPLLIRGGRVIPAQKPGLTTTESRKNDFELLVALDQFENATGELYWDDGDSLDSIEKQEFLWLSFSVSNQTLTSTKLAPSHFKDPVTLDMIRILGISHPVSKVLLNDKQIDFKYNATCSCLDILYLKFNMQNDLQLRWKYRNEESN